MLYKEIQTYKWHYFILIIGLSFLLSLYVVSTNNLVQLGVAIATGLFYSTWGIIVHHSRILTMKLMLEYALFGILGAVILISLI